MIKGFWWLAIAYSMSQFYRSCLAVFAPVLAQDIGVTPAGISDALGLWFLAFAAMQIPVGWLLDHWSPTRLVSFLLLAGGGGGAVMFSLATDIAGIKLAMILIGVGCSAILVTAYYLFARFAPADRFGALAGLMLGFGTLGSVFSATPLSFALDLVGWRATMAALGAMTVVVAIALYRFVEDPPRIERPDKGPRGTYRELFKLWPLYPVLAIASVTNAPSAGIRGSWLGGYLSDVFGLSGTGVGNVALVMAVSIIAGSFMFGYANRIFGRIEDIILIGSAMSLAGLVSLRVIAGQGPVWGVAFSVAVIGFASAVLPQIINLGRGFLPDTLVGRGVTLMNLCAIGGVGVFQFVTARIFELSASPLQPAAGYEAVFLIYLIAIAVGMAALLFGAPRRRMAREGLS